MLLQLQNKTITHRRVANVQIVYVLDYWPKIPLRNLTSKIFFLGVTNIVKNSDKEKHVYSGYRIAFDEKGSWSFNDDTATNVIISGVHNSSSFHTDNHLKNDFLILGAPERQFNINFTKAKTTVCLSLQYKSDISYLFVNGKGIYKFEALSKNNNFPSQFCLGSISNKFDYTDSKIVSFKENVSDFLNGYDAADKSNILSIHKCLMIKNNI